MSQLAPMVRRWGRRWRTSLVAAGAVLTLVVAACDANGGGSGTTDERTGASAEHELTVAEGTGAIAKESRADGTVDVPVQQVDYLLDLETGAETPLPESIDGSGQNAYAISPDGSEVAYQGLARDGTKQLFVSRLDGTRIRQITHGTFGWGGPDRPAWSPDGTKVAYVGRPASDLDRHAFVIDLRNGTTKRVPFDTRDAWDDQAIGDADHASLSPDGSLLSFLCHEDLCLANADGSDRRVIAEPSGPYWGIRSASWSPDGSRIVYWDFGPVDVYVIDVETGKTQRVARHWDAWPTWVDDHTLIIEEYTGPH